MNTGVWIGKRLTTKRILILGESHYGDENNSNDHIWEPVPYP